MTALRLSTGKHAPPNGAIQLCAMEDRRRRCDGTFAPEDTARRCWARVQKGPGCWEWVGRLNADGYGACGSERAHRISWQLTHGEIPSGLCVLHRCDNPACVRPDHLFLGTLADNNKDRAQKGRSKGVFPAGDRHPARMRRGERHWGAKLSDAEVVEIRRRHAGGETQTHLGDRYGVNAATISRIVRHVWRKEVVES